MLKPKTFYIVGGCFVLLFTILFVGGLTNASTTYSVGAGYDYATVAEAVVASTTGDIILVKSTYDDTGETYPLVIDEAITLDCESSSAVFDNASGPGSSDYLQVDVADVTIQNCSFSDVGVKLMVDDSIDVLNNNFTETTASSFAISNGGNALVFGAHSGYAPGINFSNNEITLQFSADGSDTYPIVGLGGTNENPCVISGNTFTYTSAPTEDLGATILANGGTNTISGNYIEAHSSTWSECYGWVGIQALGVLNNTGSYTTNITNNTIDMGGACTGHNSAIEYWDAWGGDGDTNTLVANINYNLITSDGGEEEVGIHIQKEESTTSLTANLDYNGFYNVPDHTKTSGTNEGSIIFNYGVNNLEDVDPLFKTNSLDLNPISTYLDVNGSDDIGAYSASRVSNVVIDDDGVVDYVTVHANSVDIIDGLRANDSVTLLAGTYGSIILSGIDNIDITGQGATTIIDATDGNHAIYLDDCDNIGFESMAIKGASGSGYDYLTSQTTFVYGGTNYDSPSLMYIDLNEPDSSYDISENNQSIASVVAHYPNENFDLVLFNMEGDYMGMMVPDSFASSTATLAAAFGMPESNFDVFVEDAVTYSDNEYTYDSAAVAAAGITITGSPSTFYINTVELVYAGVKLNDSEGNSFDSVTVDDNYYGLWLTGASDNNELFGSITNSGSYDVVSSADYADGDGNFVIGITADNYANMNVTGTNFVAWGLGASVLVIGDNSDPVEAMDVSIENDFETLTMTSNASGYLEDEGDEPIFIVGVTDSEGSTDYSSLTFTSTETVDYEVATMTEALTESGQAITFDLLATDAPARSNLLPSPWITEEESSEETEETSEEETEAELTEDEEDVEAIEEDVTEEPTEEGEVSEGETTEGEESESVDGSSESVETSTPEVVDNKPIFVEEKREVNYEQQAIKEFVSRFGFLPEGTAWSSVHFLAYGNKLTSHLTVRDRGGLLEDFYKIFNRLPLSVEDWDKVIKIFQGEKPNGILDRISVAEDEFEYIYQRAVNYVEPEEQRFIDMIAYFLRPASRDLEKEQGALSQYVDVYRALPDSTHAWSILRALAYTFVK